MNKNALWMSGLILGATTSLCVMAANKPPTSTHAHHAKSQLIKKSTNNKTVKVNINTGDANALTKINGVGPKKALAIVAYRKKNGAFKAINELTKVRGISQATLTRLEKANPGGLALK